MKTLQIVLSICLIMLSVTVKAQEAKNSINGERATAQLQSGKSDQQPPAQFVIKLPNGKTITKEEALKNGTLQVVNGLYVYSPKGVIGQTMPVIVPETKLAANSTSDGVTVMKTVEITPPAQTEAKWR